MKKIVFILLLSLGWIEVIGQVKFPPVRPYRETDYTIMEAKNFAESGSPLAISWTDSLVLNVGGGLIYAMNSGLVGQEEILALNQAIINAKNIDYILSHVFYENRKLSGGFKNSRDENGVCRFYDDTTTFNGTVGIFRLEGIVEIIVYKTRCLNLLIVEITVFVSKPVFTTTRLLEEQIPSTPPSYEDHSPYATNTSSVPPPPSKTWVQRNWYVIPIGAATVAGVCYLIVRLCSRTNTGEEEYEPRTMPEGLSQIPRGIIIPIR